MIAAHKRKYEHLRETAMINTPKIVRLLTMNLFAAAMVLTAGQFFETAAQRDPFTKPGWARPRTTNPGGGVVRTGVSGTSKAGTAAAMDIGVPAIEQRIEYFKRLRENAAASGNALPKVTSVLTLNELAVTGIFRTPRGYAAMVEATPIRLSYTIYPGDKFFDGQLVAVEENRLVFRRVTKVAKGKFVSSVENKSLRQYTDREQLQGTAPAGAEAKSETTPALVVASDGSTVKVTPRPIVSPLDEMNGVPVKDAAGSPARKSPRKRAAKRQ